MSTVRAGELSAVLAAGEDGWSVWHGPTQVGLLAWCRADGLAWIVGQLTGGVGDGLVAEGPTALSVLRRLARLTDCDGELAASPVRT